MALAVWMLGMMAVLAPLPSAAGAGPGTRTPARPRHRHHALGRMAAKGKGKGDGNSCPRFVFTDDISNAGRLADEMRYPLCEMGDKQSEAWIWVTRKYQNIKWKGWGTILYTDGSFLGSLPPRARNCIAYVLFNQNALGLNGVRYYISGGYNPKFSPKLTRNPFRTRGYWPYPSRPNTFNKYFNSTSDWQQVAFMLLARAQGANLFEAIAMSPPWWMTNSRDVQGARQKGKNNLNPAYANDHARYIARVVNYIENQPWGIKFAGVSPFNEPLEGWWTGPGERRDTEGCNWDAPAINDFLPRLRRALGPKRVIAGVDSWVKTTAVALRDDAFTPGTLSLLQRWDVHGYRGPRDPDPEEDRRWFTAVRDAGRAARKPVWQTEWGPIGIHNGTDLDNALFMARSITQHVNLLGAEAWFFGAISKMNPYWGLMRVHWRKPVHEIFVTKSYYVFQHYVRFMPQGSYPVTVDHRCGHTVLAVEDPMRGRLTVTFVNQRHVSKRVAMMLSGYSCVPGCAVSTFVTNSTHNFVRTATWRRFWPRGLYTVPADTVKSFVIKGWKKVPL